jgi:hypothetical protein
MVDNSKALNLRNHLQVTIFLNAFLTLCNMEITQCKRPFIKCLLNIANTSFYNLGAVSPILSYFILLRCSQIYENCKH